MRIAIDGAQSTGKTTLFNELKSRLGNKFHYVPEAARIVAPQFGVNRSSDWAELLASPDRLVEFFDAEINWLVRQEGARPETITDSSLFLVLAYRTTFLNAPLPAALPLGRRYDLLLVCGIDAIPLLHDDGFRFGDRRCEVEANYLELVKEHHDGKVVCLPGGANRLPAAMAAIQGLEAGRAA